MLVAGHGWMRSVFEVWIGRDVVRWLQKHIKEMHDTNEAQHNTMQCQAKMRMLGVHIITMSHDTNTAC